MNQDDSSVTNGVSVSLSTKSKDKFISPKKITPLKRKMTSDDAKVDAAWSALKSITNKNPKTNLIPLVNIPRINYVKWTLGFIRAKIYK